MRQRLDLESYWTIELKDESFGFPGPPLYLRNATFFDIQVGHDIYIGNIKSNKHEKELQCKLPYPCIWMEWFDEPLDRHVACALAEPGFLESAGSKELSDNITCLMWTMKSNTEQVKIYPMEVYFSPQDDGTVKEITVGSLGGIEYGDARAELEQVASHYIHTVLTSIGLINCKNVRSRETGSISLGRTGTEKRRKIPARKIKYHTIMLPGGGSQSDGRGGHRASAIHRVRGHFKTFTAEKPLLGQHVGTYWWGWQVRGKAENGIVVSDYKVGVK